MVFQRDDSTIQFRNHFQYFIGIDAWFTSRTCEFFYEHKSFGTALRKKRTLNKEKQRKEDDSLHVCTMSCVFMES